LKRNSAREVLDDRPLKRKCLTFIDEDDMDWLKDAIGGIKEDIRELKEYLEV
jgi:hypothetical protein